MLKFDQLIRTKLCLPFTRLELVPRPRLQGQVMQGLCGPLTLIIAPAGFGKTTLVASCVTGCRTHVAWLSLDKDDNQDVRFLRYLIAALQQVDHTIGSEAASIMEGIQPALPESILTSIVNDLDSSSTDIILVLDDYQLISSRAVHEEVAFLIEHRPHTLHLVIATRSDPPLPLSRLRARGQTVEIRAADLRFTPDETALFLNEVMGLHLDAGSVAVLEERTEGWIAGLQMAALSMRDRNDVSKFIEGFSGTHRYILDYLLEEILANQPPEIQYFLLCTSILERMTAPLCDALLAGEKEFGAGEADEQQPPELPSVRESNNVLKYLEQENVFLVALDDERIWFRYHHLFADLLRVRLKQTHADIVPLLHIRASGWLEHHGFIPEAIQHLFDVHDVDQVANLIERYGPAYWSESDPSVVQMADNLPPEMLIARPKIGLYRAWLLIIQGHIERALSLLNEMTQRLAGASSDSGQRWMLTIIRLALAFLGQRENNPGFDPLPDERILDEVPADAPILRDTADILYGMTLGRRGDIDRAAEFATRCIQQEKMPLGKLMIPTLVAFLARIYFMQGRLQSAASLCREFLTPIKEKSLRFIYNAGSMFVVLGEVLYEWNYLDEAEKYIRDGIRDNEPWVDIMTEAFELLALTRVLQAKGDYAGAMQIVEKFETRLQVRFRPHEFEEDLRTLRVRVQLASGNLQNAYLWADQIQHSEEFRLHKEYYRFSLACIRLAQGRYADVEEMLAGGTPPNDAGNQTVRQIASNLLLASAIAGQNRLSEAFVRIESCLALAEQEGYVRAFYDIGEPVRGLLAAYLRLADPAYKGYAQKLLDAFPSSSGAGFPTAQPAELIEQLTERELEVLHLMALGRTNQQIAHQLIVAPGTIKAHAAGIYRKLNVANRTEAVARARQMGILS